jgi:hypothetical protein
LESQKGIIAVTWNVFPLAHSVDELEF